MAKLRQRLFRPLVRAASAERQLLEYQIIQRFEIEQKYFTGPLPAVSYTAGSGPA
jgi:hypothetical protein